MQLALAQHEAEKFMNFIADYCQVATIAGSIRRGKPEVGDIEIVAVPQIETLRVSALDLFGGVDVVTNNLLAEYISNAVADGTLVLDTQLRRNGPKYKRFRQSGISIDLFIAEPANYGNSLAIRTGNADFSRALVTPRRHGGLMPATLEHAAGYLWRGGERIDCPTEELYFDALGVEWLEPGLRNGANAARWLGGVRPTP